MANQIVKGIGQGLGKLGLETMEKAAEEGGRILESTITGKELLGLDNTMTPEQIAQVKAEDEKQKNEEIRKIKAQMSGGGNLEREMEEARLRKERMEEQQEKTEEENEEKQEEYEEWQRDQEAAEVMMQSTNPSKQRKSRGDAGRKKKQPDLSQMSQTQEFKGKIN